MLHLPIFPTCLGFATLKGLVFIAVQIGLVSCRHDLAQHIRPFWWCLESSAISRMLNVHRKLWALESVDLSVSPTKDKDTN